jgi:hypothetical protein
MKKGIFQKTPLKFRGSHRNILKTYIPANWKNQKQIDKFHDTYTKIEPSNLNKSITSNKTEAVIKNLLTK